MLRERRKAAGLTRPQLSALSGVPVRTIEEWESKGTEGIMNAKFGNVLKVADALELWMEQLATDEYDEALNGESE